MATPNYGYEKRQKELAKKKKKEEKLKAKSEKKTNPDQAFDAEPSGDSVLPDTSPPANPA